MAFLSLSDILCGTLPHFSFYAAITNCAEVHSITDEYHCEFSVRDINTKSVTLIVRSTQEQLLPQINKPGDLIRVTGATLEERFFYTFLKFLMNCLNTRSADTRTPTIVLVIADLTDSDSIVPSFSLFDGSTSASYTPYQSAPKPVDLNPTVDFKVLDVLRHWLIDDPIQIPPLPPFSEIPQMSLESISEGIISNLIVKVWPNPDSSLNSNSNVDFLYIWDGTNAPFPPMKRHENCPTLETLWKGPIFPPKEISWKFPDIPPFGSLLPLEVPKKLAQIFFRAGGKTWVLAEKVEILVGEFGGFWGRLLPDGEIQILSSAHWMAQAAKKRYNEEVQKRNQKNGNFGFLKPSLLTRTKFGQIPISSIREILQSEAVNFQVPSFFRTVVRLVEIFPPNFEDFCEIMEESTKTESEKDNKYIYRIRVTLEDFTGRLHASLAKEDAVDFFDGLAPKEFVEGVPKAQVLKETLKLLLGRKFEEVPKENGERCFENTNPSWAEWCLFSFYKDKNNTRNSRKFKVIGTSLQIREDFH